MSAGGSATGNLSQINLTVTMATNNRLKAARVLKGMTQRKLAELVGTREIEISRIETGRCEPHLPMKEKIAAVLGKPTFELFVG
jgi:DNA-binding XRE family transcriptional regulator